jgi:hypothetical protein
VVASGNPTLSYQWYQGTSGNTSTPVGTNADSYTTPALFTTSSYWVLVTNGSGSADSNHSDDHSPEESSISNYQPVVRAARYLTSLSLIFALEQVTLKLSLNCRRITSSKQLHCDLTCLLSPGLIQFK